MSTTAWILIGLALWITHSFCFFLGILWAASRVARRSDELDELVVVLAKDACSPAEVPAEPTNALGSKPSRGDTIRPKSRLQPSMAV